MSKSDLKKIVDEVSRPDYLQRARQRTKRRKSPWNLLLIPLVLASWGIICYGMVHVVLFMSASVSSQPYSFMARSEPVKIWLVIPLLFAALPLSMIAANFFIRLLPPAKRALDKEAEGHKDMDYSSSQRMLWALGQIVVIICFTISLLVGIFVR